jgi:hypothetical protein
LDVVRILNSITYHNVTNADHSDALDIPGLSLELVATLCGGGTCPTVYRTNRGSLVVQGYAVPAEAAGVNLPTGELLVEIPADLLRAAVRAAD